MTIENGGEQPANDTAQSVVAAETDQTQAAENTEAEGNQEGEEDQEQADADDIELDIDGTKIRIARKVKEAIAKPFHQDYTRKTEELAQQRKAHQEHVEGWGKTASAVRSEEIRVAALDEQLAPYTKMTPQDWSNLRAQDPNAYQDHWVNYDFLKNKREAADRDLSVKRGELQQQSNRESGERVLKAQAEIAKHLPEWTPGGELDMKLSKYATDELKIPARELGETALRIPQLVKELNRLRLYDEAAKKQKTQATFEQSQQAKPVTRVGAASGSAQRRTTDSSGDALSTQEWAKREAERVAKQRSASGQR